MVHIAISHASDLCVWFLGGIVSVRWIHPYLNSSDKGSRFFDRDYDPSKSQLPVPASRLPRFSRHRQTTNGVLLPPGCRWMLVKCEAAVSVQSHAPSDGLSNCTGHAAAVSPQCSSVLTRVHCIGGLKKQMCHGFFWRH